MGWDHTHTGAELSEWHQEGNLLALGPTVPDLAPVPSSSGCPIGGVQCSWGHRWWESLPVLLTSQ